MEIAKKEKVICPGCGGSKIIRKGKRKNKFEIVQKYCCKECGRNFGLSDLKYKTYPGRVIMQAISLFNLASS